MLKFSVVVITVSLAAVGFAQSTLDRAAAEAEYDQLWNQIQQFNASGNDVPKEIYARYFELDRLFNPEPYERGPGDALDQASDVCPGTIIYQPEEGDYADSLFVDNGTTNGFNNDCAHPSQNPPGTCGRGPDVMFQLEVFYRDSLEIFTCGSLFDTYLCLYRDSCCGGPENLVASNNDHEFCAERSIRSYITACVEPGTYYIVLDGSGVAADGTYRLEVLFHNGCEPVIPPVCSYVELPEPEIVESVCTFGTEILCGQGYCSQIDGQGDVDVYTFTLLSCQNVNFSVWADDTPGLIGFGGGLDSYLQLFTTVCEAPISINDDYNGVNEGEPVGTDSRLSLQLAAGTYWAELTGKSTAGPYEYFLNCIPCDD